MRKTAKNSTFEEYYESCPKGHWMTQFRVEENLIVEFIFCRRIMNICKGNCPRMKRWRKIHKDEQI